MVRKRVGLHGNQNQPLPYGGLQQQQQQQTRRSSDRAIASPSHHNKTFSLSWTVVGMVFLVGIFLLMTWINVPRPKVFVKVDILQPGTGPPVSRQYQYRSRVTLYLDDEHRTPTGWSSSSSTTRVKKEGAQSLHKDNDDENDDETSKHNYIFQPGKRVIQGFTHGVLQMREGERALLQVPAALAYKDKAKGKPGSGMYIPPNSDLLFDIEILGKVGEQEDEEEEDEY